MGGLEEGFDIAAGEANESAGDVTGIVEKVEALEAKGVPNGFVLRELEEGFAVDPLLKMPLVWGAVPNGLEVALNGFVGGEVEDGFEVDGLLMIPLVCRVAVNGLDAAPNGLVVGF